MTLYDDVMRDIRKIAKHGRAAMRPRKQPGDFGQPMWMGFDDVDIATVLQRHAGETGPCLTKLRADMAVARKSAGDVLYFWPLTKTQARALLREVRREAA